MSCAHQLLPPHCYEMAATVGWSECLHRVSNAGRRRSEQSSVAEAPRELPLPVRAEWIDLPGPGATARIRQAMVGD